MTTAAVYFFTPEGHSMFSGSPGTVPIGGAGAVEYYLAEALASEGDLTVRWVFPVEYDIAGLQHHSIEIRQPEPPIRRGIPLYSRRENRRRVAEQFIHDGPRIAIAPLYIARSSSLWKSAVGSGCTPVVRIASDDNLLDPSPTGLTVFLKSLYSGDASGWPFLIVHTEWQLARARELIPVGASDLVVHVPKGWAHPESPPQWEGRGHTLWVGSCRSVKQPWLMLEAARALPSESFVMVMPPFQGKSYDDLFRTIVRDAHRIPNLRVVDRQIPIADVDTLFLGAKLYVNTSEWEGFANTFLQAGTAAVPVVSLSVDPDSYLVRHGAGVSCSGSFSELVTAINLWTGPDTERAREAGVAHWKYVAENHSPTETVRLFRERVLTRI